MMSVEGELASVSEWSGWLAFDDAVDRAPRLPGVYMARASGLIVYVGMAGERRGKGLQERLAVYASGKAAVSGLGEAALNRALANPAWVRDRLAEVEAGVPRNAKGWARAAIEAMDLEICWTCTADREAAAVLERQVIELLADEPLWNVRGRLRPG